MNLINDTIQMESRREIENIMTVVSEYIKRHQKDDSTELAAARELYDKLDVMHMTW